MGRGERGEFRMGSGDLVMLTRIGEPGEGPLLGWGKVGVKWKDGKGKEILGFEG